MSHSQPLNSASDGTPGASSAADAGGMDFERIREASRMRAATLLQAWLPEGRRESDEWGARNPMRADDAPGSFKINIASGEWANFASGDKGGYLIELRAFLDGSSQVGAALKLAAELGILPQASAGMTLERYAEAIPPILASGLFQDTGARITTGFVQAPVWRLRDPAHIPPTERRPERERR